MSDVILHDSCTSISPPGLLKFTPDKYRQAFVELLLFDNEEYWVDMSGVARLDLPGKASYIAFPGFPPRHTVFVFCSTIHLNAAMVFMMAEHNLRYTGCRLEISFFPNSSQAVQAFRRASLEGYAALVTVTDGTAKQLQQCGKNEEESYQAFLEVQPSHLQWSSPVSDSVSPIFSTDFINDLNFGYFSHPTDLLIFDEFCKTWLQSKRLNARKQNLQSFLVTDAPERLDIYYSLRKNEFLLTNTFLSRWALLGRSPYVIAGWRRLERRFIYGNRALWSLLDGKGRSIAHWLQIYLSRNFENLPTVKQQFIGQIQSRGRHEFLKHSLGYLGVLD